MAVVRVAGVPCPVRVVVSLLLLLVLLQVFFFFLNNWINSHGSF